MQEWLQSPGEFFLYNQWHDAFSCKLCSLGSTEKNSGRVKSGDLVSQMSSEMTCLQNL